MEDSFRSPLEQLESEAIASIRETAALFERPALLNTGDPRSRALAALTTQALAPRAESLPALPRKQDGYDAFLSAESGPNFEVWPLFGKPPRGDDPWEVFPLASWSERDVERFLSDRGQERDQRRLLRLCTVGQKESGKSSVVRALAPEATESVHHHLLTPERRFFLIDPPGQEPYSHGLMAAASASEAALLVVDAQRGLTSTARRQAFLLALMGVPHLVVVVNKMDLVGYSRSVYESVVGDFQTLSTTIELKNLSFVPLSASAQENVCRFSALMPWYEGAPLLPHLEQITPGSLKNLTDLRLPLQKAHHGESRTVLGGRLASGRLAVGDRVVVLPSGQESEVVELRRGSRRSDLAIAGDSVTLTLQDRVEAGWGDLLAAPKSLPTRSSEIEAVLLWLVKEPQREETTYLLHHGTRLVNAHVSEVLELLDADTLAWGPGDPLGRGEIGRVRLTTAAPLYFDSYTANRETGAFALLDPETREVLGAGVLRGPTLDIPDVSAGAERLVSDNVVEDLTLVGPDKRQAAYGHRPAVLWFTGLSGSGKSTVAKEVERRLFESGCHTLYLDGDNVRTGLNGDLGFTEEARTESNRRVSELAKLAHGQGQIVVCSFISGKQDDREFTRSLLPEGDYLELFVNCPIDVCRSRDPKKLYQKADAGQLLSFSGISIPYEAPENPDLELNSDQVPVEQLADRVIALLTQRGILSIPGDSPGGETT